MIVIRYNRHHVTLGCRRAPYTYTNDNNNNKIISLVPSWKTERILITLCAHVHEKNNAQLILSRFLLVFAVLRLKCSLCGFSLSLFVALSFTSDLNYSIANKYFFVRKSEFDCIVFRNATMSTGLDGTFFFTLLSHVHYWSNEMNWNSCGCRRIHIKKLQLHCHYKELKAT